MARISVILCFVCVAFLSIILSAASHKDVASDHSEHSKKKESVGFYEIKKGDFSIKFTNWGASIVSVILPDKHGKLDDIVLGYDKISTYKNDTTYFGATVGRVANRIGGAKFTIDGKTYKLSANEGKNTLHGGVRGFSDVIWKVSKHVPDGQAPYITFSYHSHDGEQGFPGDVKVRVTYMILGGSKLNVIMKAKAVDKATPINLAQHAYWNLGGHNSGDILSNTIQIFGSHITPVDKELIPTGKIEAVKGTPYDLTEPTVIGSKIHKLTGGGYDINYALDGKETAGSLKKAAIVHDSKSGRVMELWTNQPGLQFYTSNMVKNVKGKDGAVYNQYAAMCLETQGFPDSVNHPNFPSQIVYPGKSYKHFMIFKFSTK
ncbi:galactose mutarotase-like [Macadamia integrifolia]|uniref:galactose mutarotase-like n=1 Tax=Macadamia integrifolia TaxID=60698 RepID=UPI001C4FAFE1|nr:galactose mutarotase-like [Macadamia integrifolia]